MSKVMIVDDDLSVTKALQRGLSHAGFDVETYFSAHAFLTRDALDEPACVILDLELPELNGLEVQRQLRADAALPIIFLAMQLGASENTVKIHRGRAMHKLEIHSVAELVRIVDRVDMRKSHA